MSKKHTIVLFLLCFISGYNVYSQEYSYKHYTVKDGLPQSQVVSLHQDKQGYVWVGTKMGLARFDGHHFEHFSTADGLLSDKVVGYLGFADFLRAQMNNLFDSGQLFSCKYVRVFL